jgi:hypothetical protein
VAQQWRYPLAPIASGAGTAVTAAALTSGLGGLPIPQLPPLDRPGGRLIVEAQLEHTSTSATPTVVLSIYLGSVGQAIGSKTLVAASSALAISASATAWPIMVYYSGRFRTLSPSAGVIYGQGWIKQGSALTTFNAPVPFPITAALRTVSTLNTDQTNEVDFGITLSSVTGTPSFTVTDFAAEYSG